MLFKRTVCDKSTWLYVLVWQIAKHPTGQIWKNNREVIVKKWNFIDFFVPLSKAINDILLKTLISQFHCNSRGWVAKRISRWHIIDCVIFLLQTKKRNKAIEGRVTESEETMTVLDSLLSDTHDSWCCWSVTRTGFTQKRIWWESKIHHQGMTFDQIKKIWILYLGWFVLFCF